MARLGRTPYVPGEDQLKQEDPSPVEMMLSAAEPSLAPLSMLAAFSEEEGVAFPPWEPTGDETPQRTVELDRNNSNENTVPPPQTAGGSIPSAFARFRQYGPDEA